MKSTAAHLLSVPLLLLFSLCNSRPTEETNAERLKRGLAPLTPRRLFDATKVASECRKRKDSLAFRFPLYWLGDTALTVRLSFYQLRSDRLYQAVQSLLIAILDTI